MPRLPFLFWSVAFTAWIAAVGYFAWNSWPHMPLDISQTDPATRAAYDSAVLTHIARHAALAFVPPLIVLAISRLIRKAAS